MLVRTIDYKKFLDFCFEKESKDSAEYEAEQSIRKSRHDAHWWNKMFDIRYYDDSFWGNQGKSQMYETQKEIDKCVYALKICTFRIEPKWADSFYKYCKDNNIPY